MKRVALLILAGCIAVSAQPRRTAQFRESPAPRPKSALVDPNDRVFPDIVAGGGWETLVSFVNMLGSPAQFTLTFYDDNGNPVRMPLVNPDGSVSRFSSVDFSLDTNTSTELVVANVDNTLSSVWGYLSFPGNPAPIAGMAVVRTYDSSMNVLNESTESLSNLQDFDFYAPFDNLQGVSTGLILLNPSTVLTSNIRLSAQDANGNEIVRDSFSLAPGARTHIQLPTAYTALAGTSGKLRVTGDTNRLSAVCYRISPAGSLAYSPIFNWSGMFH
jgi:hypothetical protein